MARPTVSSVSWCLQVSKQYLVGLGHRYRRLHIIGKSFVWFLVLFHIALFTLLIVFRPARIFQFLYNAAQQLRAMQFGWLILFTIMVVGSFPPIVGYSTCVSVCGFAYGLEGFYVAGSATLVGSGLAFIVLRLLFKKQVAAWASKNEKWQALEAVIEAKGLPLIILIRLSPFPPYVYSQALFASISVVKFWQFMLATVIFLPKIFLAVFIGSRVAKFSDEDQRGKMDTTTKVLNGASIAIGVLLGLGVGWFLYRTTRQKIRSLRELPPEVDALAAEALEGADEGAPLLQGFPSDSLDQAELSQEHHSIELSPSRTQSPRII